MLGDNDIGKGHESESQARSEKIEELRMLKRLPELRMLTLENNPIAKVARLAPHTLARR